jgi:NAD-dependent deacetylase
MHGQLRSMLCRACGAAQPAPDAYDGSTRCPQCAVEGGLRPDIVWFGEIPYHMDTILARLRVCDLFIAIGTSGVVYPAAGFVQEAVVSNALTIEVNREFSDVSGLFHQRRRGMATTEVVALVEELLAD